MKPFHLWSTIFTLAFTSTLPAKELESGPQPGEPVGAFYVEKCAGNESDGVASGEKLCYRCMLGNRPVVAIFSRSTDQTVSKLVKELDGVVQSNKDKKMASFVNLLGADPNSLKTAAEALVKESNATQIAVVVPDEHDTGPANYRLNPKADVTIVIYNRGRVEANYALTPGLLNDNVIKQISTSATKMVN